MTEPRKWTRKAWEALSLDDQWTFLMLAEPCMTEHQNLVGRWASGFTGPMPEGCKPHSIRGDVLTLHVRVRSVKRTKGKR